MSNELNKVLPVFNTILNYHQSLRLEEIASLNKSILKQNVLQNKKLKELNEQMAAANAVQKLILQNQINEITQKEKQRFYKAQVFKVSNMIEAISSTGDILLQKYLLIHYYDLIKNTLTDAMASLDEIADKEYSKASIRKIETIKSEADLKNEEFEKSYLRTVDELVKDYNTQKAKIDDLKPVTPKRVKYRIKSRYNILRVIALVLLGIIILFLLLALIGAFSQGFNASALIVVFPIVALITGTSIGFYAILKVESKWQKNYHSYKEKVDAKYTEEMKKNLVISNMANDEIVQQKNSLNNHLALTAIKEISSKHPEFVNKTQELFEMSKS